MEAKPSRSTTRLPFDASYPAHLKVLLAFLARSTAPGLATEFGESLRRCLDYLLSYWSSASFGALCEVMEPAVKAGEESTWEQSVRLLGYSAMTWGAHPKNTFAAVMRVGFFEQAEGASAQPRLHTRWLLLAGDPLPDGVAVGQLGQWDSVDLSSPAIRNQYMEILASWLRSSRPLFVKFARHYEGPQVRLTLNGPGSPARVTLRPPLPWARLGLTLSQAQIDEAEVSPGPPPFVADLWTQLHTVAAPTPPAPEPESEEPSADLRIPETLHPVLQTNLLALREGLERPREWPTLAAQVVHQLRDYLCLGTMLCVRALQSRGPVPETLRSALLRAGQPDPALKLLHFCIAGLQSRAVGGLRDAVLELFDGEGPVARWLGLPEHARHGLENLTWWTLASQGRDVAAAEAEAQLQQVIQVLSGWSQGLADLLEGAEFGRDEQGCLSGLWEWEGRSVSLDLGELTTVKPLTEILNWLRHRQQRQTAPEHLLQEVRDYVESVATGGGLVLQGLDGAGKSLLLDRLRASVPGRERWVSLESCADLLLERLNEGLGPEGLVPMALADVRRYHPNQTDAADPLGAYLLALSYRNQRSADEHDSKVVFLLDDLQSLLDNPWVMTHLPTPYCWIATTSEPLPSSWPVVMPPARLSIALDDPNYQRFLLDSVAPLTRLDRYTLESLVDRPGVTLLTAQLWVGMLESGLVPAVHDLPAPSALVDVLAHRLAGSPEYNPDHLLFVLLAGHPPGVPMQLLQSVGVTEDSLARMLGSFPSLFRLDEDVLRLAHESLAPALIEALPRSGELLAEALARYLRADEAAPGSQPEIILKWACRAAMDDEANDDLVFNDWFRKLREQAAAGYDERGQGHRKVDLLNLWIEFLEGHGADATEERPWAYSSRALTYRSLGCLDRALQDADQAVQGFEEMLERRAPVQNGLAAALNRRSEIRRERGHYSQALADADRATEVYQKVVARAEEDAQAGRGGKAQLEPLLALALHNRGALYVHLGQLENAANDLRRALDHYRPWQDQLSTRIRFDMAQALRTRGSVSLLREEPMQARDDANWALQQLQRLEEGQLSQDVAVEEARCLHLLAEAHLVLEDQDKALQVSDQAAQLWQKLVDQGRLDLRPLHAQELFRRGHLLWSLGRCEEAMAVCQPSVDHLLQLVEAEGRGELSDWLGQALLLRGRLWQHSHKLEAAKRDYSLAYHYLSSSYGEDVEQQPTADHHDALSPLVEAGICLAELHLSAREELPAVTQLRNVLQLLRAGSLTAILEKRARLLHLLGQALETVNLDESLEHLDQAAEAYGELVDHQGQYQLLPRLAETHLSRARVRHRQMSVEGALEDAEMALQLLTFLSEKGGDPGVLALLGPARLDAAEILLSLGQPDRALQLLNDALDELDVMGVVPPMLQARAMKLRGQIRAHLQHFDQAIQDFTEAVNTYRELQGSEPTAADLLGQCLLLRSQVTLQTGKTEDAMRDVLNGFGLGGQSISEGWERFELLLQTLREQARRFLAERALEPAIAAYDQLLIFADRAYDLASPGEIRPYLVRAYQERGLARFTGRDLPGALKDLTHALKAACLVSHSSPTLEDSMLVARLFETRSQIHVAMGQQEKALLDLGRALESLNVALPQPPPHKRRRGFPSPPDEERTLEETRLALYRTRADMARELSLVAEEWRDLKACLELMLPQLGLGEESIRQGVVHVHRRRAQMLTELGQLQAAQDEYRDAVRAVRFRLSSMTDDRRREIQPQLLELLFERWRSLPEEHQLSELGPLSEALEQVLEAIRLTLPVRELVPIEVMRRVLETADPTRLQRVAQLWMQILSSKSARLPEEWLQLFPLTLQRAIVEGENSTTLIPALHRLEACAVESARPGCPERPWVGDTFMRLMQVPTATWQANPPALQAFRRSVEAWQRVAPLVAAQSNIPDEQLEAYLAATPSDELTPAPAE